MQKPRQHTRNTKATIESDILLVGQPNVGKSVLFSRITGIRTIASNYPGTTVSYTAGRTRYEGQDLSVVDAPGSYALEPLDEAGRVTVDLLDHAKRIINVVDATHLERHLPLTFELLAQNEDSLVVALNMCDEARHRGISIDTEKLSQELGIPVIPIVARTGEGVKTLMDTVMALPPREVSDVQEPGHPGHHPHLKHLHHGHHAGHTHLRRHQVWERIGDIVGDTQTLRHHHHTLGERMEDLSVHPVVGSLIALIVLVLSFSLTRIIGEFLIGGGIGILGDPWVEIPFGTELFFEKLVKPLLEQLSRLLKPGTFLHSLLIGSLIDGEIDFMQSFGILTSGLFVPLGAVLPYIISFYLVLSLLEDSGYLPRLAVFLDNLMHRLGLHGYAIIPTLLGMGCNVPGIMATRILETRRQRFITATLISTAIPCTALQAMIIGIVGDRGLGALLWVFGTLVATWFLLGLILRFSSREFRPELLVEIPPYRLPSFRALMSKMWMRVSSFLREALPVIMGAVLVVNILYQLEVFQYIARIARPLVTRLWGMPEESIVPLLIGILRKDVAVGMFLPLALTTKQLIIGSVVLSMFFPCLATFVVLFRELGFKDGIKSIGIMLLTVTAVGSILNLLL
ncbi:MAG: ferrous iron transporter B [Spirochaetales bacterium]|nr:ferrous iron transporter B [Spirochaetales bacterium]